MKALPFLAAAVIAGSAAVLSLGVPALDSAPASTSSAQPTDAAQNGDPVPRLLTRLAESE